MDAQEKKEKIKKWQTCGFFHPLTCGKCGENLEPKEDKEFKANRVYLFCPKCKHRQDFVPDIVYLVKFEEFEKLWNELNKK